jgi:hypothetical protein
MFFRLYFLLPILFHASFHVAALRFGLSGRLTSPHFHKRAHVSGLDNAQNLKYFTNITLGEKQFSVNIDTGRQAVFYSIRYLASETPH